MERAKVSTMTCQCKKHCYGFVFNSAVWVRLFLYELSKYCWVLRTVHNNDVMYCTLCLDCQSKSSILHCVCLWKCYVSIYRYWRFVPCLCLVSFINCMDSHKIIKLRIILFMGSAHAIYPNLSSSWISVQSLEIRTLSILGKIAQLFVNNVSCILGK